MSPAQPGAQPAPAPNEPPPSQIRGLIGIGGLAIPDAATAGAAQGGAVFRSPDTSNDARFLAIVAHVSTDATDTTAIVLAAQADYWLGNGVYGLGFGGGFGYASFTAVKPGGWSDSSGMAGAYLIPAEFRFGASKRFEIELSAGAMRFFTHDVRPWGYLAFNVQLGR